VLKKEMDLQPDFVEFYNENHQRLIQAVALSIGDFDLASEAVDEAMAKGFFKWRRIGQGNPHGWVYRVAINFATDGFRRRRKDTRFEGYSPSTNLGFANIDPEIRSLLMALPLDQRKVIVLRYFFDWSQEQTAEALGIKEGTVKSRTNRALVVLKEKLEYGRTKAGCYE
jgi:RNA polymerase sigma factor (sigma-70 family)